VVDAIGSVEVKREGNRLGIKEGHKDDCVERGPLGIVIGSIEGIALRSDNDPEDGLSLALDGVLLGTNENLEDGTLLGPKEGGSEGASPGQKDSSGEGQKLSL